MFVNPIVVLAGACANNGMPMFANELLSQDRGNRDCKAIRKSSKRFSGMRLTTVARVMDNRAKCGTL